MKHLQSKSTPQYLKLHDSSNEKSRSVNDRGDFVKKESPTRWNVNGTVYHSSSTAANAIAKWGKK